MEGLTTYQSSAWGLPWMVQAVKTSPSVAGGVGLIPSQGTKIPQASWPKMQNRGNILTDSIKTLKMVPI